MPDVDHFSDSEESFHSFDDDEPSPPQSAQPSQTEPRGRTRSPTHQPDPPPKQEIERFDPEEEAAMVAESNSLKGSGNLQFGQGTFGEAIQTYDKALASCPTYLDYELAVLRSNIAACHLKLEEWKEAVESAEKGLDCLERLEPLPQPEKKRQGEEDQGAEGEAAQIEEVDDGLEARIEHLRRSGRSLDQVRKLQVKLLTRRAKAKTEQGGWAALQAAEEDYRVLLSPGISPSLSPTDRRQIQDAARALGPRLQEAREREMAEMMGKLKGLGNSLLKPFGLSTENFQFVKDENTGGYSMNFNQGGR